MPNGPRATQRADSFGRCWNGSSRSQLLKATRKEDETWRGKDEKIAGFTRSETRPEKCSGVSSCITRDEIDDSVGFRLRLRRGSSTRRPSWNRRRDGFSQSDTSVADMRSWQTQLTRTWPRLLAARNGTRNGTKRNGCSCSQK